MSDFITFGRQLLRHPLQTMALAPSSDRLCAEMAAQCRDLDGPVIELGGGTGKISRALIKGGLDPENLHTLEINPDFLELLQSRLPDSHVHNLRAEHLEDTGLTNIAAVVSGLPLLSMPEDVQRDIVRGAFNILRPGGAFVQFTYGYKAPVRADIIKEVGIGYTTSERIWGNLPPATVYRFTKEAVAAE